MVGKDCLRCLDGLQYAARGCALPKAVISGSRSLERDSPDRGFWIPWGNHRCVLPIGGNIAERGRGRAPDGASTDREVTQVRILLIVRSITKRSRARNGTRSDRKVTQVITTGARLCLREMYSKDLQQSSPPGPNWNRKKCKNLNGNIPKRSYWLSHLISILGDIELQN